MAQTPHEPPQSTSVSSPSCAPLAQRAVRQSPVHAAISGAVASGLSQAAANSAIARHAYRIAIVSLRIRDLSNRRSLVRSFARARGGSVTDLAREIGRLAYDAQVSHDEPTPRARRFDRDLVVALMSGFIGALALAVSSYNVYLQHKQVRAQVWPRLLLMPSLNDEGFQYHLENGGIGPAEIRGIRVFVDGKRVEDWPAAILCLTGHNVPDHGWSYSTMGGTLAIAGQTRRVLAVADPAIATAMFKGQRRLRTEICYCSALEDCWVLESNVPRPVSQCPDYGDDEFHD